jgi:periplasmic protein TonB
MNKSENNSWDDIVFEYRNKEYGAYPLRYNYPKVVSISGLIVMVVFIGSMVTRQILQEEMLQGQRGVKVINYTELEQPPPIEKVEVQAPKAAAKYVAPEVTFEEEEEDEFMTMDEARALLDTTTTEVPTGNEVPDELKDIVIIEPPPEPETKAEPIPEPVVIVQPPEFPGGTEALQKWLGSHLNYPAMAVRMGIEGVVVVEFSVGIDGKLSDAKVVQSLHKLCDNEALRLVKSMPDWTPGAAESVKQTAKVTLPIRFILQ